MAAEEVEELPRLPVWGKTFSFHNATGYKDNILLSEANLESSLLVNNGLDFSLVRLPIDGPEVQLLLSGEDVRYFDAPSVNKEQLVIAFAQMAHEFASVWRGALNFQYAYQDQVFDASITETNLSTVRPKGQTLRVRPALRRYFQTNYWLEAEAIVSRQIFAGPLDDFWDGGGKWSLGRKYGNRSEMTLAYQYNHRLYDERPPFTADGQAIPGEILKFDQHSAEFSWKHNWDKARRWQTLTRLGYLASRDNGQGYFDYDRFSFSGQLRFANEKWEVRLRSKISHYAYPVQTVSSTDQQLRSRNDLTFGCRLERKLKEWMKVYCEYEHERALSNREDERYSANTISGGVEFEF